jgi:Ca2+-binding RTX toxin-like protein
MTDMFTGGSMAFEFFGHGGADTFIAGTGTEKFDGGADVDTVNYSGSSSGVTAYLDGTVGSGGAAQGDVLVGIEQLTGSQWNDKLYGDGNNNILHGGNGNDYLTGMLGDDFVFGDDGDDEVRGHSGNDVLFGGTGNDLLDGGEGYDELHGGAGNDRLVAFSGGDLMWGDQGNDVFVFHNYSNWTGATVMDFEFGDKIELSASSLGGKSVSNTKLIDTSGGTIIDLQYYDVFVAGVTHTDFTSSSFLFV